METHNYTEVDRTQIPIATLQTVKQMVAFCSMTLDLGFYVRVKWFESTGEEGTAAGYVDKEAHTIHLLAGRSPLETARTSAHEIYHLSLRAGDHGYDEEQDCDKFAAWAMKQEWFDDGIIASYAGNPRTKINPEFAYACKCRDRLKTVGHGLISQNEKIIKNSDAYSDSEFKHQLSISKKMQADFDKARTEFEKVRHLADAVFIQSEMSESDSREALDEFMQSWFQSLIVRR